MANTPFPTPVGENDGYVYEHPTTGRKYQLSTYTTGRDISNVWSAVSDVKNRTWVGSNDPLEDNPGTNGPVVGDTWWDTQYLELRVLHHPIIGINDSGKEPVPIYGVKNWISSTHPMANMLGEGGADKNQMIGRVAISSPDPFILEGESINVQMTLPQYTGFDNFYEDPTEDTVLYEDKRFTVEWSLNRDHNIDISDLTEVEAQEYENTIELVDPTYPNRAKVRMGKLGPDSEDQVITARCTVTVKEEYNNEFIIMGLDEDGKPKPHESYGTKGLRNGKRASTEVIVPVGIATQTLESFVNNEGFLNSPSDTVKGDLVKYFYMANGELKVPNPDVDNPELHPILSKYDNNGSSEWMDDRLSVDEVAKQLPHVVWTWNFGEFSETKIIFDFGLSGSTSTIGERLSEITQEIDLADFIDTDEDYDPSAAISDFKMTFYEHGFRINDSGDGPEIPKASDYSIDFPSVVDPSYSIGGNNHCVIIVTLNYSTTVVPQQGIYFVAKAGDTFVGDGTAQGITSHGQIIRGDSGPLSLDDVSDEDIIIDDTTEETTEETP